MRIHFILFTLLLILSSTSFAVDFQAGASLNNIASSNNETDGDGYLFLFGGLIFESDSSKKLLEIGDIEYETKIPNGRTLDEGNLKVKGTSFALILIPKTGSILGDADIQIGFGFVDLNYNHSSSRQKIDRTLGTQFILNWNFPSFGTSGSDKLFFGPTIRYFYVKPTLTTNGSKEEINFSETHLGLRAAFNF